MENDPVGPEIPKIETAVMRSESESKAGFFSVLLSKLGLGGASGAAAGVGSGIIASKAGIVALIVAGSSVAAGITMLTSVGNETRSASTQDSAAVFASLDAQSAAAAKKAAEERAAAQAVSPDGSSGSLDFLNSANKGMVSDPTKPPAENKEGASEATEWSDSAAKDSKVQAPQHDTQSSAASPSAAAARVSAGLSRPTMAKKQGFGGTGGGGTSATLVASANMGGTPSSRGQGGTAGGRMGAMDGGSRGGRAAGTKMAANLRTKNMASDQLKAHSGAMRGNLASGNVSSQGSGTVMDGGRGGSGSIGGAAGGIGGGGVGSGAAGLDVGRVSENTNLDTKEVPSATSSEDDGEDKANYQTEMYTALGCIAVWIGCMIALGFVKKKMKAVVAAAGTGVLAAPAAAELASLLTMAKLLVGVATLAAGVAVACGASIVNKGEMMIGGLIAAVGGFMLLDGAVRLYNLMSEDPPAEGASVAQATTYTKDFGGGLMSVMKDIDIFGSAAAAPK